MTVLRTFHDDHKAITEQDETLYDEALIGDNLGCNLQIVIPVRGR